MLGPVDGAEASVFHEMVVAIGTTHKVLEAALQEVIGSSAGLDGVEVVIGWRRDEDTGFVTEPSSSLKAYSGTQVPAGPEVTQRTLPSRDANVAHAPCQQAHSDTVGNRG